MSKPVVNDDHQEHQNFNNETEILKLEILALREQIEHISAINSQLIQENCLLLGSITVH